MFSKIQITCVLTLSIKSIFIWCFYPVIDVSTWSSLRVSFPMTQLIILIALLLSFRCLMQPLVPFVVLLSCSVSFTPPGKSQSAWTPTVDLGLSSGASAGEASPQPFLKHGFHCTVAQQNGWCEWWKDGKNRQCLWDCHRQLELLEAMWNLLYGGCGWFERGMAVGIQAWKERASTQLLIDLLPLYCCLQSLACFIRWKQCFTNITLRKWFPCVLFFIL